MEENRKRRVRFNLFDAVIVVLVLAALGAALLLRNRSTGTAVSRETFPMRFTVEMTGAPPGVADCLRIGGDVYRSTDNTYLGKLADFHSVPHVETEYSDATGAYVRYETDTLRDVYLTIENEGYTTATEIVIGSIAVRIGGEMPVKGQGFARAAYIVAVDTMDAPVVENTDAGSGDKEAVYLLRFNDTRDIYLDSIRVGDRLYEGGTNGSGALLGVVRDVRIEPHGEIKLGPDGEAIWAEKPERYAVTVELAGRYVEKSDGYYLGGGAELKVGASVNVRSRYIERQALYYELLSTGDAS